MNGQYANSKEAERQSSLEALSRTIDGLEARIEDLVSRQSTRSGEQPAHQPAGGQVSATSHRPVTSQILERQRLLDRERAKLEARLGSRRVTRRAERDLPASDNGLREIAEALVGLRAELKADFSEGFAREMARLREEIAAISADAQPLPSSMRDDLLRLAESIERLGGGGKDAELFEELQGLRAAIEVFAGAAERNWSAIEQSLHEIEPQTLRGEVVGLAERLEEIKRAIDVLPASHAAKDAEEQLKAVAAALEALAEQVNLDDAALDHRFAGMAERLDEISRAIVAVGSKADRSADAETLARIEGGMEGLSRQMASFGAGDGFADLAERVAALTERVEMLASEETVAGLGERLDQLSAMLERGGYPAGDSDLAERLVEISGKIDALDQGAVNAALAERLDDLAARIDGIAGGMADHFDALADAHAVPLPGLERLEEQLTEIARRLDETRSAPDGSALRGLEAQLAHLSELIVGPVGEAADLALEPRLVAIEEHLATNDEYVIEAARQAAEAVVEAYAVNRVGAGGAQAGELAVIAELAEDLRALEQVSQRSEERTARAFDAVHDTLVKIAEHLEKLGQVREGAVAAAPDGPDGEDHHFASEDDEALLLSMQDEDDPARNQAGEAEAETDEEEQAVLKQPARVEAKAEDALAEAGEAPDEPAGRGFFASLGRKIRPSRSEPVMGDEEAVAGTRAELGEAPSIDPADSLEPVSLNEPLEPGSGAPDIAQIMRKVREVQNAKAGTGDDKTDFIAAARRAAQAAAAEVETMEGGKKRKGSGLAALIRRSRRPILMAVGAVLLAVMSWPLVSAYMHGPQAPVVSKAVTEPAAVAKNISAKSATSPETTAATMGPALPKVRVVEAAKASADNAQPAAPKADPVDASRPAPAASAPIAAGASNRSGSDIAKTEIKSATPAVASASSASPAVTPATSPAPAENASAAPAVAPTAPAPASASPSALPAVPAAIGPQSLRQAAEKGQPNALFEIGARYTEGRGVDIDLAEAAKWYEAAAERGLAPAEYRLANFYEKGSGVERNVSAAHDWYEKAADQGNVSAMHNLAVLYAMGKDGKPDYDMAAKWFRKAADHGVKDSQFNLAILYAQGRGVPHDLVESYKWFAIAASDGDHDATQKRDEVAAALKPDQLKKAREEVSGWKPEPPDPAANSVSIPPEWSGKDTRTASIDMSKAIRNIQAILDNNGFDAGRPDGVMGDKTRAAIKAFQKSIGAKPTGEIDDALIKKLLELNQKKQQS